jgi:hypothetical protein
MILSLPHSEPSVASPGMNRLAANRRPATAADDRR